MNQADSSNEGPLPDMHKELALLEAQLAEDSNNPNLCWNVTLAAAAIYVRGKNDEIRGIESDIDLEPYGEKAIHAARRVIEVCPENHCSFTNLATYLNLFPYIEKVLEWSRLEGDDQISNALEIESPIVSKEAYDLYKRALEVNPKDCNFLGLLIPHCLANGKYERAEELISHGLSVDGMSGYETSLYQARIEREKGNYAEAIDQFRKLFGSKPESSDCDCDLIETYRLSGRFEEMVSLADATLKECPNVANAYCSLAKYYESQGRTEEASVAHHNFCKLVNENLKRLWLNQT